MSKCKIIVIDKTLILRLCCGWRLKEYFEVYEFANLEEGDFGILK